MNLIRRRHRFGGKFGDRFIKRFWNKVKRSNNKNRCWEWTGHVNNRGYGRAEYMYRKWGTHRVSYELYHNIKIPKDMCVCHCCDNPVCCNPYHLFLGTVQDNMTDKVRKNRQTKGSGFGHSKLVAKDVREIVKLLNRGVAHKIITKRYNISSTRISFIATGKAWTHITGGPVRHNNGVVLDMKKVRKIRRLYKTGKYIQRQLAKRFGVSRQQIGLIVNNKRWAVAREQ